MFSDSIHQSEVRSTFYLINSLLQGGNGSSGSGSSASRKPIRIHGATSLYSLRSLSKEEERCGSKISMRGRGGAPSKKVTRGASLENEYSEFDERDDVENDANGLNANVVDNDVSGGIGKSTDFQEDSDGLWGDDEDDDFKR